MFPASAGFSLLAPEGVSGFELSGNVWKGQAQLIETGGIRIRQFNWTLNPLRLLTGSVSGKFSAKLDDGFAEGSLSSSFTGAITVTDFQAATNLRTLRPLISIPGTQGQVSLRIQALELVDEWPRKLIGSAEVGGLASSMITGGQSITLGSFELSFDENSVGDNGSFTGQLRDTGGPLELTGTVVLNPPGNYQLNARIKSRPDAPNVLANSLRVMGNPTADGGVQFGLSGSF